MEKVSVFHKGKKIIVDCHPCSFFGKFWGLMFSQREKERVLLFDFERDISYSIHSFFVFYSFLAVWIDSRGRVIQVNIVKPWVLSLRPNKKYRKLIEIPINKRNKQLVQKFIQK